MSRSPDVIDRLRIEWAVWSLDQRLYELPRRTRIARRRELRANLLDATPGLGVGVAIARLGDPRRLAEDYLDAELGPGARPSWYAAALVLTAFPLFFLSLSHDVADAFRAGIVAIERDATGTFSTEGIDGLQSEITYTLVGGEGTYTGGSMTPLCFALMFLAAVLVGRLWLIPRAWWRRRRSGSASVPAPTGS